MRKELTVAYFKLLIRNLHIVQRTSSGWVVSGLRYISVVESGYLILPTQVINPEFACSTEDILRMGCVWVEIYQRCGKWLFDPSDTSY